MFFRFRKRKPAGPPADAALPLNSDDNADRPATDWVPEPAQADAAPQDAGVELGKNPHKGKAIESARGSHR